MTEFNIRLVHDRAPLSLVSDGRKTLLETLQDAGLSTRNPCRNGVCGLCKCRLVSGEIDYNGRVPHGLWDREKAQGYILPCISYPVSDIEVDSIATVDSDPASTT